MIDVSVILINYNSSTYTIQCIQSIFENTSEKINYEIIIVDNKSKKEDFLKLKKYCTSLKSSKLLLVPNSKNSGFGGGNMVGFNLAKGNYIAFVNNDVIFKNDCLSIILDTLSTNKNVGVCGPTTYTENGQILPTLDFFTSPLKVILGRNVFKFIRPKAYKQRKTKLTEITAGDFVSGSFMMLKKNIFIEAGGFDTNIFLYHEETDLCKRLKKLNLIAVCQPKAECIHFHGASTQKSVKIKAELKRSLLYVIKKHYGNLAYSCVRFYLIVSYSIKIIVKPKYVYILKQLLRPVSLDQSTKTYD